MREELDDREIGRRVFENGLEAGAIEIDGEIVNCIGDGDVGVADDGSSLEVREQEEEEEK